MTVAESIKAPEDMPYDWDEVLVLDPDWSIRPDDNRAVQTNRDPGTFSRGLITTERAILTALLDGKRTLADLAVAVSYLFDLPPAQARHTVQRFAKDTVIHLVRLRDVPEGRTIPVYDPARFASAGAKFSTHRRLKSPIIITWMPTLQCGTNCLYCYMNRRPIPANGMLPDKRVRQLLEEVIGLQIPTMSVVGGDPFAHPHILDYLDMLLRAGIRVQISTKMPLTGAQVMCLADIGVKEIQFSIDGPNAEICDFLVQTPGWFNRAIKTIRRLIDAGISVSTNTILTSFNVRYAIETAAMLCDLGAYRSKLTNYTRSLAHHSESFWVPDDQARRVLEQMDDLRKTYPGRELLYAIDKDYSEMSPEERQKRWPPPPSCTAYVDNLVICPDGSCIPTEQIPQWEQYIVGNVRDATIQEVWDSPRMHRMYHPPRELFKGTVCYPCDDFDGCHYQRGWCFRDALMAYGTIYAPSPNCPKAPRGLKLMGTA